MTTCTLQDWKEFIAAIPQAHILQSPAWGKLKSVYGWEPVWIINGEIGAQILLQRIPLGYRIGYIARGPLSQTGVPYLSSQWIDFQDELDQICHERKVVFLKIEPDIWESIDQQPPKGYRVSPHSIQPPRSILVDLGGTEDQILQRMKSKTRYNIRLAAKKGISVKKLDDVNVFYELLANTSDRAEFGIHTLEYYQDVYNLFKSDGHTQLFLAEFEGEPLASIMVFVYGRRSWYFYGASSDSHREKMPTYLIQWEAMRWAKEHGCESYDLWGVPDENLETLEENFTNRSDDLWGVYRFKRGFGGDLVRTHGPWDKVYSPLLYRLYVLMAKVNSP
jgi:lipid II:glycine glycyltransferase (peptidoglycan interpeptide bridge formation enzyme)